MEQYIPCRSRTLRLRYGISLAELADAAGISPQEYVDRIVATFQSLWKLLNISYDRFIRTTDDYHVESVKKIFKALYDKGDIYKGCPGRGGGGVFLPPFQVRRQDSGPLR